MNTYTGYLHGASRDYKTSDPVLSFRITEGELEDPQSWEGKPLTITVKEKKKQRSLDSNAYFHLLCDRLREKLGISMSRCKNILISRYGQIEYIDNEQVVIKTNIPPDKMYEYETLHCIPCGVDIQNGKEINYYRVYRGSHTYDTAEMTRLIKGTIEECEQVGIVTLTPAEIERMLGRWSPKEGR